MEGSAAPHVWQLVFSGILGLTYVLAGYSTMRFTARMTSAILFLGLGALVAHHVQSPLAGAGILAVSAILGFVLGNAFYFVNVAALGAGAGVVLAAVASAALGGRLGWASGIAGGISGAGLAILFERPIGVLGTSIVGAALTLLAVKIPLLMIGEPHSKRLALSALGLFLGLVAIGCAVQGHTTRNLPRRQPEPRPREAL